MSSLAADSRSTALGRLPRRFAVEPLTDYVFFQEGPGLRKWQWTEDGMKVINGRNILADGRIDLSNTERFISPVEFEDKYSHFAIENGDIVVTSSGTIGKVGRIHEGNLPLMMNTSVIRFHPLSNETINPDFLFAFLRSPLFLNQARSFAIGAAQLNFGPLHIKQMKIVVPPIREQRRVASILSAYDHLIENNQRRIPLLEEAARLLYKEWFVHLRFPGHEHVVVTDGVPEGWERKTAIEAMDVLSGGTPKTAVRDYWGGDIPFFTPKDATEHAYAFSTEKTLTEDGLQSCNSNLYPKDTVFITARGTVGKINLAQTDMAMNQSCYALVADEPVNQHFLYFALREGVEQFRRRASGAVFDAIVRDTFKLIPFTVPSQTLIRTFSDYASPLLRQIDVLSAQTRKLTEARDLLLPRLMNGKLAV